MIQASGDSLNGPSPARSRLDSCSSDAVSPAAPAGAAPHENLAASLIPLFEHCFDISPLLPMREREALRLLWEQAKRALLWECRRIELTTAVVEASVRVSHEALAGAVQHKTFAQLRGAQLELEEFLA
jgi:hypothetical protein